MECRTTFRSYGAPIHFGIINPPAYAGGYRQAAPYGALVFGFAKNGDALLRFVFDETGAVAPVRFVFDETSGVIIRSD